MQPPTPPLLYRRPYLAGLASLFFIPSAAAFAAISTMVVISLLPGSHIRVGGLGGFGDFIYIFLGYCALGFILFGIYTYREGGKKTLLWVFLSAILLFAVCALFMPAMNLPPKIEAQQTAQEKKSGHGLFLNDMTFTPGAAAEGNTLSAITINFDLDVRQEDSYTFVLRGVSPSARLSLSWVENLKPGHQTVSKTIAVTDIDPENPYNYIWLNEGNMEIEWQVLRPKHVLRREISESVAQKTIKVPVTLAKK